MAHNDTSEEMNIKITNLTLAQKIAIEDMLATWIQLGSMGASRWTCFFADGDGNFHPDIKINEKKPTLTEFVSADERWKTEIYGINEAYKIDFDWIAWRLKD